MRTFGLLVSTLALAAVSLGACSQQAAAPASAGAGGGYLAEASGRANVTTDGSTITATRAGEGSVGVVFRQAPVQVSFTVDDPNAVVRARQDGQWIELPAAGSHSVMIGQGGANQVRVETREGDSVAVRVTGVVDCTTATCTPLATPEAAPAETPSAPAP